MQTPERTFCNDSTTHVPVGEDQTQHLELTRDLASAINERFQADIFTIPSGYSGKSAAVSLAREAHSSKGSAPQDVVPCAPTIPSFLRFQRSGLTHNEPAKADGENEQVRPLRFVSDQSRRQVAVLVKKICGSHHVFRLLNSLYLTSANDLDPADLIRKKIRKAQTDALGPVTVDREVRCQVEHRPCAHFTLLNSTSSHPFTTSYRIVRASLTSSICMLLSVLS